MALIAGLGASIVIGVLRGAYPPDQLIRPVVGENIEQAAPVEQLVPIDGCGGAVGEQSGPVQPTGSMKRDRAGDRFVRCGWLAAKASSPLRPLCGSPFRTPGLAAAS
jgi:hypothetical protein